MEFDEYIIDLNADCTYGCMDGNRFHNIYRFPNDRGASVVSSPKNDAKNPGGYRVMLIRFDSPAPEHMWTLDQGNPFGKAVIDCKDWDTVLGYLRRLYSMPSPQE